MQPLLTSTVPPLLSPPPPQIVAAAGTAYFAAAATASGLLYTWRGGGNALLPPLALGSPPVSMSAQGHFQLLVVGADGSILTLDLEQVCCCVRVLGVLWSGRVVRMIHILIRSKCDQQDTGVHLCWSCFHRCSTGSGG
jgi:hypothetical protein